MIKFLITILYLIPVLTFGQVNKKILNDEYEVINQFILTFCQFERLDGFKQTEEPLVLYFQTKLTGDLENQYQDETDHELVNKFKDGQVSSVILDSTKINQQKDLKMIFGHSKMYSYNKYKLEKVIGTISFSRVIFNDSKDLGCLFYSVYRGEDNGWGGLLTIEKKNGDWKIKEYLSCWIS